MNNQKNSETLQILKKKIYFERCNFSDYQERINDLSELEKNNFSVNVTSNDEYEDRNFYECYTCNHFEYLGSSYPVKAQCNFYPVFSKAVEENDLCHIRHLPKRKFYNLLIAQTFEKALSRQKIAKLNNEIYNLKQSK